MNTYEIPATSVLMWAVVCGMLIMHTYINWKTFSLEYRWWYLCGGIVFAVFLLWSVWSNFGITYFFGWSLVWSLIKVRKSRVFRSTVARRLNDSTLLLNYVVPYPTLDKYRDERLIRYRAYVWHLGNDLISFMIVCGLGWVFDHLHSLF